MFCCSLDEKLGLFHTFARINHSCIPNSIATFPPEPEKDSRMTVRAVKPIEVGEEVTISYVTFWPLLNYCGTMKMFATAQARQDGVSVTCPLDV